MGSSEEAQRGKWTWRTLVHSPPPARPPNSCVSLVTHCGCYPLAGVALAPCHDACAAWNHVANLVATTSAGLQAGTQLTGVAASGAVERSYARTLFCAFCVFCFVLLTFTHTLRPCPAALNEWRQVAVLSPRMPPTKGFASTHVMDAAAPRLWLYGGISAQVNAFSRNQCSASTRSA